MSEGGERCIAEKISEGIIAEKKKLSPQAAAEDEAIAKRPSIGGLLDQPLATRFLNDPIIDGFCNRLAAIQPVVKTAQQLLEALRGSKVLADGTLNYDALKHFALVLKTWRNNHFRTGIYEIIAKPVLRVCFACHHRRTSKGVLSEEIKERMCRIKEDQNLRDILEVANTPGAAATTIRGLLIVIISYWSYKELLTKLKSGEEISVEDECDAVEDQTDNVSVEYDEKLQLEREKHGEWLMEYGSPVQILSEEPAIEELGDELMKDPRLSEKALECMAFLLRYDPKDEGTLNFAKQHYDLAHEVLEDSHFIHLLFERIKRDTEARCFVSESGEQRVKVKREDLLATINGIMGDAGLRDYEEHIKNDEVGLALRVFLSVVILHWLHKDVYEKVSEKLEEYDLAQLKPIIDRRIAAAKANDNIRAFLQYRTRFAGDFKDMKAALERLYDGKPYGHAFAELKIAQYEVEIDFRERQYDVEIERMEAQMSKGECVGMRYKVRRT
ncbi:ankyrin repeat-containing protein 2 [Striga asiatica]|uniref:Ankyrin repeat-containing protein 2 n=1 Tax=Striga asiatica TaxID=4170 RepID=A0A5A7PEH9_STRAF|nr:ankyrin repeat-containing protein 2 [Striga asiatica]